MKALTLPVTLIALAAIVLASGYLQAADHAADHAAEHAAEHSAAPSTSDATTRAASPATQPATRPAGRTDHDLLREIAEFDQKYVVEAYEQHGRRNPKWDAAALKLVRAQYEASIYNTYLGGFYVPTDRPAPMSAVERGALANEVLDSGCDDSMALFMAGFALEEAGLPRCETAFVLADGNAGESAYLPLYKVLMLDASWQRRDRLAEGDPILVSLRDRFRDLWRQVLTDKETLPKYRAVVWAKGATWFDDSDHDRSDRIATAIADVAKDADPWLFETYMGHVEISRAWKSRGGGYADTVTDDGFKGLRDHLALARKHLEKANELDLTLPHAAALMLTVEMGESGNEAGKWFKESTRRQMDYLPAYNGIRNIVQPRWSGSVAQQLALAKREVDTGRFDTRVPQLAMDVADDLERDAGRPLTVIELNQIAPTIDRALAGYLTPGHTEAIQQWAKSTRVVWLAMTKHWAEARKVLDTMPILDNAPAEHRDLEGREILGQIYAMTGPSADAIRKAINAADAADRTRQLTEIVATLPDDAEAAKSVQPARAQSGANWVKRRLVEATFEASLAGGKWTPLPIAPDLDGWRIDHGSWKADGDNAIIGSAKGGLLAIAPFQMPERFEFRCTVEPVGDANPHDKAIYAYAAWSPNNPIGAFAIIPESSGNLIRRNYNYGTFPLAREGDATTLRLRFKDGVFAAIDEAGNVLAKSPMQINAIRRPAFGGLRNTTGATWRFSDIAVRALK